MPEHPTDDEVVDALHDSLLRTLAKMVPTGGPRSMPISVLCNSLIVVMAEILVAAQPDMPPDPEEISRLTKLFRQQLEQALAERQRGGPVGHA